MAFFLALSLSLVRVRAGEGFRAAAAAGGFCHFFAQRGLALFGGKALFPCEKDLQRVKTVRTEN